MATTCPNCKTRLSCGCQTRKASNGSSVCTNCIGKFEANLSMAKKAQKSNSLEQDNLNNAK